MTLSSQCKFCQTVKFSVWCLLDLKQTKKTPCILDKSQTPFSLRSPPCGPLGVLGFWFENLWPLAAGLARPAAQKDPGPWTLTPDLTPGWLLSGTLRGFGQHLLCVYICVCIVHSVEQLLSPYRFVQRCSLYVCVRACMVNSFRGLTADPVQMGGVGVGAVVCSWNICLCFS